MADVERSPNDGILRQIYLFADSRPLFVQRDGTYLLEPLRTVIGADHLKAAYIGASNGDDPSYYSIFEAAMANIGVEDCRMVRSSFGNEDRSKLVDADIVLLAGGNVKRGWEAMQSTGLGEAVIARYNAGAVLMGVSAGAVQLGLVGWDEEDAGSLFYTFGLAPFVIGAHDEEKSWASLKNAIQFLGNGTVGIGIPYGGGMTYLPDRAIEPVCSQLEEFSMTDGHLRHSIILSGEGLAARGD